MEYTFPEPVSLAAAKLGGDGGGWTKVIIGQGRHTVTKKKSEEMRSPLHSTHVPCREPQQAYAAFPCLNCAVTDAGCYYEFKEDRATQIAFLTGAQYKALLAACPKPQEATKACWEAAGLKVCACG